MGDSQYCALFESSADYCLDELIVLYIDVSRGLVNQNHPAFLQESPTDAYKLPLAHR